MFDPRYQADFPPLYPPLEKSRFRVALAEVCAKITAITATTSATAELCTMSGRFVKLEETPVKVPIRPDGHDQIRKTQD